MTEKPSLTQKAGGGEEAEKLLLRRETQPLIYWLAGSWPVAAVALAQTGSWPVNLILADSDGWKGIDPDDWWEWLGWTAWQRARQCGK